MCCEKITNSKRKIYGKALLSEIILISPQQLLLSELILFLSWSSAGCTESHSHLTGQEQERHVLLSEHLSSRDLPVQVPSKQQAFCIVVIFSLFWQEKVYGARAYLIEVLTIKGGEAWINFQIQIKDQLLWSANSSSYFSSWQRPCLQSCNRVNLAQCPVMRPAVDLGHMLGITGLLLCTAAQAGLLQTRATWDCSHW